MIEAGSQHDCRRVDREVDRHLAAGGSLSSMELHGYLEACPRCRALYGEVAASGRALPEGLEDRIVAGIRGSLIGAAPLSSNLTLTAQAIAVFLLLVAAIAGRMQWRGLEVMTAAQAIGMGAALAAGTGLMAAWLVRGMRPGSRRRISDRAAGGAAALALIAALVFLFPWKAPEAFLSRGIQCLGAGVAMALPAALAFWIFARRGAPLNLTFVSGAVGALGGLVGMTVLQLTCEHQDRLHLSVWHGGVPVLSAAAGILAGGFLQRLAVPPRSRLR